MTLTSDRYKDTHGHNPYVYTYTHPIYLRETMNSLSSYPTECQHLIETQVHATVFTVSQVSLCDLGVYELCFIVPIEMNIVF